MYDVPTHEAAADARVVQLGRQGRALNGEEPPFA